MAAFSMQPLKALTVQSTAGGLPTALKGQVAAELTELTVAGEIDASDFKYIADSLKALSKLDLSAAKVVAYSNRYALFGNRINYPADEIPSLCFLGTQLKEVALPAGTQAIGEGAFAGCSKLTTVSMPDGVTAIGDCAFSGASELTAISGGKAIRTIGDYAFKGCAKLLAMQMDSVQTVGDYAFLDCAAFNRFSFSKKISHIGEGAFKGSGIRDVDLMHASIDTIAPWTFAEMPDLEAAMLPAVDSLGNGAFYGSAKLQRASWTGTLTKISDFAFMGTYISCENFLDEGIREIGNYALADWSQPSSFIIPSTVERIGDHAFQNWTKLKELIAYPIVPPALGADVWAGVNRGSVWLRVPQQAAPAYEEAEQWRDFSRQSGIEETANDIRATVAFDAGAIRLTAPSDIATATLYAVNGTMVATLNPGQPEAIFNVSDTQTQVFILRYVLADGRSGLFKIGKNN